MDEEAEGPADSVPEGGVVGADEQVPELEVPSEGINLGEGVVFYYTMRGCRSCGFTLPKDVADAIRVKAFADVGWRDSEGDEPALAFHEPNHGPDTFQIISTYPSKSKLVSASDRPAQRKGFLINTGGVYVVTGSSGGGKSMFVRALAYQRQNAHPDSVFIYNVGEPRGNNRHAANAITFAKILNCIARANPGDLFVIDSLSSIAAVGGSSGKGGVSRDVLVYLDLLEAAASHRGCYVLAVINPLTSDADAVAALVEGVKGSASGYFVTQSVQRNDPPADGSGVAAAITHTIAFQGAIRPTRVLLKDIEIVTPVASLKISGSELPYLSAGRPLPKSWESLISGEWRNL